MKYQDDLVSIITPAYKAANTIEHTVDSVLAQDYKNWEMIIVNDCSPDNTSEVIHNLEKKDRRIKAFDQEKNGGAASAWNRAFKEAQGRYIAFLDVDDLWVPTKLKEQIHFMKKNGYAFTYAYIKAVLDLVRFVIDQDVVKLVNKVSDRHVDTDYHTLFVRRIATIYLCRFRCCRLTLCNSFRTFGYEQNQNSERRITPNLCKSKSSYHNM